MPASERLEQRVARRIEELTASGLRRTLRAPAGIDLSSNDYLGLAGDPRLRERMAAAVMSGGCGSTGSRLLRGEREAFASVEARFAAFKATEAALFFGSGYAANLAVLGTFLDEGDTVFSDELNHASLIDGLRLARARRVVFPHADVSALRKLLEEKRQGETFLVTESLFSMDGDAAPLRDYAELCRETGTNLIVDEAHAVGVYGANGSGLIESEAIADDVFLSINTAGKALGVGGAFVAGPGWAKDYLVQRARPFVFSTAPPPAVAAAIDCALDIVEQEPERRATLLERASLVRSLLRSGGLPCGAGDSQIIPVVIGDNERACAIAEQLQSEGFDVRPIRPPTVPVGTARLRLSINVDLDETTLRRFVTALLGASLQVKSCLASS